MKTEPVVYRRIPACDAGALAAAAVLGMADLHEALGTVGGRQGLMAPAMRPIAHGLRCVGQAVTAYNYPGDNLMMHKALSLATAGQVLVVTNGGFAQGALFGEMAGHYARAKKLAGVVIDGPTRDVDALRNMGLPVWATSINAAHAEKRGPGAVNIPIVCGGALVEPGDIIAADGDGVLVIPRKALAEAVADAQGRGTHEAVMRLHLDRGEPLFPPNRLADALAAAGIAEIDAEWSGDCSARG